MTQFFTTPDGLRLAYDEHGTGHPLLCLAGLSRNMADFNPVVTGFAARARIIRLDSRGRGQSDYDPDFNKYTVAQECQDVLALLDHLGLDTVSILGTSRGGLIAMTLATTAPDRLHGAVLNDIGPVVNTDGLTHILGYIGKTPGYADYDDAVAKLPAAMAPDFVNVSPETWRAFAEALWVETPDGLDIRYDANLLKAIEAQASDGTLPEIWPFFDALATKPTGLIRGGNSNLLSAETTAEMRRRQPEMIFAEVPDRGHVPFLDEPESRKAIADYLDRVC